MIPFNTFEDLREEYKPDKIEVLFVGESRPQGGTFFYLANSALYGETKKAFDEYLAQDIFSLTNFKNWNLWLYDICDEPVNGMNNLQRAEHIHTRMPQLIEFIEDVKPKIIIVCKKTFVENNIRQTSIMDHYNDGMNIFFLPFPANGRQVEYREGLIKVLDSIDFRIS